MSAKTRASPVVEGYRPERQRWERDYMKLLDELVQRLRDEGVAGVAGPASRAVKIRILRSMSKAGKAAVEIVDKVLVRPRTARRPRGLGRRAWLRRRGAGSIDLCRRGNTTAATVLEI